MHDRNREYYSPTTSIGIPEQHAIGLMHEVTMCVVNGEMRLVVAALSPYRSPTKCLLVLVLSMFLADASDHVGVNTITRDVITSMFKQHRGIAIGWPASKRS